MESKRKAEEDSGKRKGKKRKFPRLENWGEGGHTMDTTSMVDTVLREEPVKNKNTTKRDLEARGVTECLGETGRKAQNEVNNQEVIEKETEKMIKRSEKLLERKQAISNEVRKQKFKFKTRGKITKNEEKELRRTHGNIFDWVRKERNAEIEKQEFEKKVDAEDSMEVDERDLEKEDRLSRVVARKRMFLTRRLCQEILEEVLTEASRYRVKEMIDNVMEMVMARAVLESRVNEMIKDAEKQGYEVIAKLEEKLLERRKEEEDAALRLLKEEQKEERLKLQLRRKEEWSMRFWRIQEEGLTTKLRDLKLLEEAIFMDWEKDPIRDILEEMDTTTMEQDDLEDVEMEDWTGFLDPQWEMDATTKEENDLEDVEMEDWSLFLESQEEQDYWLWMMGELAEMGLDFQEMELGLAEMELELEDGPIHIAHGDVDKTPATPGISRKLGELELEDEECLCSGACSHVEVEKEKDECICSARCDTVHIEEDIIQDIEEVTKCDTVHKEEVEDKDINLGIKYCPGLEVELPRYDYIEYKPRYSSKPYIYFGVGPCEEQPGGVDDVQGMAHSAQAGRRGDESGPGKDMFGSGQKIKSLIAAWESMEEGGEEGKLTLPGGLEDGRGRRKSQKFVDICSKFGGLGVQTEGRTDKQLGKFKNPCSFTDVASTLLGPFCWGRGARRKLHFVRNKANSESLPAMGNGVTGLARPSANQKRARSSDDWGQGGAKKHRFGES